MKRLLFLLILSIPFYVTAKAGDNNNHVQANLTSVILYRTGAEMVHNASSLMKQGNNELIIDNLSNNVDFNSVQIKAPSSVTVLGIEFSNNYQVKELKTPRVQALQDSLERIKTQLDKLNLSINNTVELLDVLKTNKEIKGEQNGLSVAELTKLMDYYQSKSLELQTAVAGFLEKKENLEELSNKIKKQIQEEEKKNTVTAGRLILQLNAAIASKAEFTISYIARNAYWTPYYDVRVENIKSPSKLFYKAKIVQTTGIDWKQVKLSLSTSVPAQKGTAPQLDSWFLGYVVNNNIKIRGASITNLEGRLAGLSVNSSQLNDVVVIGYGSTTSSGADLSNNYVPPKPVYVLNGNIISDYEFNNINPNSIKKLTTLKAKEASNLYGSTAGGGAIVVELKDGLNEYVSVNNNSLNVNFNIDIPYDVPTNGKEQTATLQTVEMPTVYEHISIPKKDIDAYLIAKLPDWEQLNLLPGEANIILEGTYIGKTVIDPNAATDTLMLTLGRDKRVIVEREKLADYSSVKFLGNNKLQKFTYEITVKNNKAETINLQLKDQYPLTTNKEIEVELVDAEGAEINKETGLINWNLNLVANETKKVKFSYTIKYQKNRSVNIN